MSDQKDIVKYYETDELTIVWKPKQCIHSERCFHGLPQVFNPKQRPWVNKEAASAERIAEQVKHCPSGALSIIWKDDSKNATSTDGSPATTVQVLPNGPLLVKGSIKIKLPDGSEHYKEESTALCRCGASQNKPFCDGSHQKVDFKG